LTALRKALKSAAKTWPTKKCFFNQRVRNQYIKQRSSSSPLLLFLATDEAIDLTQEVWANRMVARRDQEELIEIAQTFLLCKKIRNFWKKKKLIWRR